MLNERGGYESDFTVTMLDHNEYMIVTGSAQAVRDRDVIERAFAALPDPPRCEVVDITSMSCGDCGDGPEIARAAAARVDRKFFAAGFSVRHIALRSTSGTRQYVQRGLPMSVSLDGSFTFRWSSLSACTRR